MNTFKKAASVILAIMTLFALCVAVKAAGYSYYAVSGVIYDDGTAIIERAEIVDGVEEAEQSGGYDYAIVAEDYDYNTINTKAFSVKFTGYPDGIGTVSVVPFTVLIPYSGEIYSFSLRNSSNEILSEIEIDNDIDVSDFTVKENDDGFSLSWSGADGLTYDVTAVSEKTGLRLVLLYASEETEAQIPFEWLEPNDRVSFELAAQSGNGTAVLVSDSFNTPDGAAAVFADADGGEWEEAYADNSDRTRGDEAFELTPGDMAALVKIIAIVGGVLILTVVVGVIIIVKAIKKKQ